MPTPLLPRLNDSNSIAIARRGEWISTEQNSLPNLIKSLKVTKDMQASVTSIPDLWAHPAVVEMALLDKEHPKHKFYRNQWRGILAMLALYSARNIKELDIKSYNVPAFNNIKGADEPEFLKVLANMIPEKIRRYEHTDSGEYKIQVLTYSSKPLAFIWPSIFVCPAIEIGSNDEAGSSVSWWLRNIQDPISKLSIEERVLLRDWLENAKRYVSIKEENFLKLIQEYENALDVDNQQVRFDDATGIPVKGYCSFLSYNKKMPIDKEFVNNSHVMLVNIKKNPNLPNLLVITPDMDELWDVPANKIIIAGSTTFDTMRSACMGGIVLDKKDLNGCDISKFAELRSSEDFFTTQVGLVYTSSEEEQIFTNDLKPITKTINASKVNVILPLKEEILNYLTTSYIKENIDVIIDGTDITVSLDLPLSGIDSEKKLKISKTYKRVNQQIKDFFNAPLIQLWPNFIPPVPKQNERSRWEAYYSFFSAPEGWEKAGFFYAKPFWDNCVPRKFIEAQNYSEIIRGKSFPEAYICYDIQDAVSGEKQSEIGVVLLDISKAQELPSATSNKKCRIGVDFGTTNTVSYYSINGNEPDVMRFENRLYSITNITNENSDDLRRNFFSAVIQPNNQDNLKLSSIRSMFHTYSGSADTESNRPMMSGNIYYLENGSNIDDDDYMVGNSSIHDDIKWNEDGINNMTGFLVQYTMQCLAEAVVDGATQVEWAYSYPKSYTKRQVLSLSGIWEGTIKNQLDDINGLTTEITSKSKLEESVAMAEYFSYKMKGNVERGMVCFDIGGGSTDVAVWQGSEKNGMRYQCSIKFAGRNILNEYLYSLKEKKKSLLLDLSSKNFDYNSLLNSVNNASATKFNMKLEALLKYYENEIFAILPAKTATIEEPISVVVRDIAFSLAGILYYVGKIVSYLREIKKYDELYKLPECYIGGNASKLLNWAGSGRFDNELGERFAICFTWGMDSYGNGLPDVSYSDSTYHAKVIKTKAAKEEVAYGLVNNSYITLDAQAQTDTSNSKWKKLKNQSDESADNKTLVSDILAGEDFTIDGESPIKDIITIENILYSNVRVNEKCPQFKAFVEAFNAAFEGIFVPVNFTAADYSQICQDVNKELNQQHRNGEKNADNIVVEPLFIMILREAVRTLALK